MKTLFEKLLLQLTVIAHPAGSLLRTSGSQPKRIGSKYAPEVSLSPECYNLRGRSNKAGDVRRTPAP